jgi:hypothetical protein
MDWWEVGGIPRKIPSFLRVEVQIEQHLPFPGTVEVTFFQQQILARRVIAVGRDAPIPVSKVADQLVTRGPDTTPWFVHDVVVDFGKDLVPDRSLLSP